MLDHSILGWTFPLVARTSATHARLLEDEQGGTVRLVVRMSQVSAYHSPKQCAKFDAENARQERIRQQVRERRKQARNKGGT